ncbi:MAG: hypothetical protein ACKOIB_03390, partial [Verrucomicrobiota bacterium]
GMIHRIRRVYFTSLSLSEAQQIVAAASQAASASLTPCSLGTYRIERPGSCIKVALKSAGAVTQLFFEFKQCAKNLWAALIKLLSARLHVRRLKADAVASGSVARAVVSVPSDVEKAVASFIGSQGVATSVVFTSTARRHASNCKYRHVQKLQTVLEGLRRAGAVIRAGRPAGLTDDLFWSTALQRSVTLRVSDTQLQMFPEDYHADFEGERFVGHYHVTLGTGWSESDCMSVHWAVCERTRRIIIVRCGKHGRTHR